MVNMLLNNNDILDTMLVKKWLLIIYLDYFKYRINVFRQIYSN